jgi:phenylalanyl-tRNA synthetase beta chain
MSGKRVENNWAHGDETSSVFEMKAHVENILRRLGLQPEKLVLNSVSNDIYTSGMTMTTHAGRVLGAFGIVNDQVLKMMDIDNEVYFAELSWDALMKEIQDVRVTFGEISKFPEVKRDLALLADKNVTFADIRKTAQQSERNLLNGIVLFDVYEGNNLPHNKKSYAVSFYLQDNDKTLNDHQIDAIMSKIQNKLEEKLGIQLR